MFFLFFYRAKITLFLSRSKVYKLSIENYKYILYILQLEIMEFLHTMIIEPCAI